MAIKKTYKLFNILGNDIRFNIVNYLASEEKCVCNIFKKFNLPQNLTSHHLGILRENKVISDRKDGKRVYYSLNKKTLAELKKTLEKILH
ncbi:MAG: metalloregulator ArsR/SmtB family transcription factor [Patescibacteria group bacterium]|nr:metalloregulator ArsR/SmtB family transcription factor [Patescibacteria group bacterium]